YMPDEEAEKKAASYLDEMMRNKDSAGGIVECIVTGMPAGIGDPVFDKLDAGLAKAVMSIGAVKGVEIGAGFRASSMKGSENNDSYEMDGNNIVKLTNNAGGVSGGISDGADIVLRAAFKPTPSIATTQKTVSKNGEDIEISIKGRHDPIIVPRAVVVVEAMTGITIADMLLKNMTANVDNVRKVYGK
ncbi:MAG: chorismate synthase, partial [Lachnospiraceae bacterium]|nr:chorismate synthase [Lachnospiraceae bacterium]